MELSEIIKQRILTEGPISFHDFMEMALYHPGSGYYTTHDKIGKQGDFYTSSNVTPVFGAMIGKQLEEMWLLTGGNEFTIVEYGAGTGALCHDILDHLKENSKMYDHLHYAIIEKSPAMRERQKTHLDTKVGWYESIRDIGGITGCILSNELVDNLAVHQVVMADELMEVYVDYKEGFAELLRPADMKLKEYFAALNVTLPRGFRTEINMEATEWISEVAASLEKGYVMTIDYGGMSEELYVPRRRDGTLLCYYQHQRSDDPYKNIGAQDITAHVNFSALRHWGLKHGLADCGLTGQADFLLALGFRDHLANMPTGNNDMAQMAMKAARLSHMLLVEMGNKFKVLIQQKGLMDKALMGMKGSA